MARAVQTKAWQLSSVHLWALAIRSRAWVCKLCPQWLIRTAWALVLGRLVKGINISIWWLMYFSKRVLIAFSIIEPGNNCLQQQRVLHFFQKEYCQLERVATFNCCHTLNAIDNSPIKKSLLEYQLINELKKKTQLQSVCTQQKYVDVNLHCGLIARGASSADISPAGNQFDVVYQEIVWACAA